MTTVSHIIQKCKIYGTVGDLPRRDHREKFDDQSKRRKIHMVTKEERKTSKEFKGEVQAQ